MESLNAKRISALLALPGVRVETCETLDSTNAACRRLLDAGSGECLVLAGSQTGGRGRRGRAFFSPPGGLYLSVGVPQAHGGADLTCRAAVVTAEAIARVTGIECGVKWVNDLYLAGKKVCGILAESGAAGTVVGVGVNLIPAPLPPELRPRVGFLDCGDLREPLAAEIARGLLRFDSEDRAFMDAYRSRSVVLGKRLQCEVGGRRFDARAVEIADDGALIVEGPEGRETLRWGEVTIRGDF